MPLEENINRIVPEEGTVEARTIEDAIAALRYSIRWGCHCKITLWGFLLQSVT